MRTKLHYIAVLPEYHSIGLIVYMSSAARLTTNLQVIMLQIIRPHLRFIIDQLEKLNDALYFIAKSKKYKRVNKNGTNEK